MTHREVLKRLQDDFEITQIHGSDCFATKLLDLAAKYYEEQRIKNRCFAYLVATEQYTAYHQTTDEDLKKMTNDILNSNE